MFAIYKKEMRSYFTNPIGYVFSGIFLVFSALLCCYTTLLSKSYDTSSYFTLMIVAFVILIPLLTMRLFSEERKMRTEQLLLTAPVTITGMVMGKFCAAFTLFLGCLGVSCINLIPLYAIAAVETKNLGHDTTYVGPVSAEIVGCLIGLILIGAAFIAIGTLISSLAENQQIIEPCIQYCTTNTCVQWKHSCLHAPKQCGYNRTNRHWKIRKCQNTQIP